MEVIQEVAPVEGSPVITNPDRRFAGFSFDHCGDFFAFTPWDRNGQGTIWRMDMDGSDRKQLTSVKVDYRPAVWPGGGF